MNTLGVIGGLGPMATAYFMQLMVEMTEAQKDQEHIPMVLFNAPQIPDRTQFLLGNSKENPASMMIDLGHKLYQLEVDCIAIPCITAHAMHEMLQEKIQVPIIHAIKETVNYLKDNGVQCVGLEATDGTIQTRVFQDELEKQGIKVVLPQKEHQEIIMDIIYNQVKASKPICMSSFLEIEQQLKKNGVEVIILGCTELSMIKRDYKLNAGYLDVLDILARCAVLRCGSLKEHYNQLITR